MNKGFIICFLVQIIILSTGVPIASFVIASHHKDASCGQNGIVSLPTWLIVNGAVVLGFGVVNTGVLLGAYLKESIKLGFVWMGIIIVQSLFIILPWNIIGAISLFRDSASCRYGSAHAMWAITLASLIFQWIGMCSTLCVNRSRKQIENV